MFPHSNPEGQGVVLLVDAGGQKIPAPHGRHVVARTALTVGE